MISVSDSEFLLYRFQEKLISVTCYRRMFSEGTRPRQSSNVLLLFFGQGLVSKRHANCQVNSAYTYVDGWCNSRQSSA